MGESNGAWGAMPDDDLQAQWDTVPMLPSAGEDATLDAFCASKHITIEALVRIGTRLASPGVLAFAYSHGIKYRNMLTGQRWASPEATFPELKIVYQGAKPARQVIVAEGETDAARLTVAYPAADVAVLPAGALTWTDQYAAQLAGYELVHVALDDDEAGNQGAGHILDTLPQAVRLKPPAPAGDWCEVDGTHFPPLATSGGRLIVPAGDLVDLEAPDIASWFEQAVLPIAGQLILHGWAKGFKSFMAFDMLSALAQGQDWCGFEPTEEPCRVCVMQFEIPWPYYQERVKTMLQHAKEPTAFRENYMTWTPTRRPQLIAGNRAQEDFILRALVSQCVQVLLVDPIRRPMGTNDMNAEADARKILGFFERIQDQGITVVATHHDNKVFAKAGGGDILGMTGAGAFSGDADTIVSVALPKGMNIQDPKRNLIFTSRNAPPPTDRSMEMREDGSIVYGLGRHGAGEADDQPEYDGPPV